MYRVGKELTLRDFVWRNCKTSFANEDSYLSSVLPATWTLNSSTGTRHTGDDDDDDDGDSDDAQFVH